MKEVPKSLYTCVYGEVHKLRNNSNWVIIYNLFLAEKNSNPSVINDQVVSFFHVKYSEKDLFGLLAKKWT